MADPGNGNTTIHIAAQNGNIEMLQLVMGAGAHVNKQNKGGQTPLHMVSIPQCGVNAAHCSVMRCRALRHHDVRAWLHYMPWD